MTYAQAVAHRDALEAALLTSVGVVTVSSGEDSITYQNEGAARAALARLNRDIQAYERRAAGQNPFWSRPKWS